MWSLWSIKWNIEFVLKDLHYFSEVIIYKIYQVKMLFPFLFFITDTILDLYLKNAAVIWFRAVEFLNVNFRMFIWRQHFIQIPVMCWTGVLDDNHLSLKSVCDLFCYELPGEGLDIVMLLSIFPVYKGSKTHFCKWHFVIKYDMLVLLPKL